jgi:hypothetical protein
MRGRIEEVLGAGVRAGVSGWSGRAVAKDGPL